MILITGGLGFIGSHIALSLMAQGQEVILVDNLANANLQTLERLEYISGMYVPFVKVDVRNTPALNKVFEQYSVDAVVHCAGFKSLEESRLKPLEYYNDNVSCIMSLLRAMQRTGTRNFIHISSLAVYGKSSLALEEQDSFNYDYPNPYIKSQQMIEHIIQDTCKTDTEWKVAILRVANVVGAFEHGVLGELVTPLPKNIVPLAMQVAAMQRDSIELYQKADTTDGTVERGFVHVLDVCNAVQASLYWLSHQQEGTCEAFNIASTAYSIQDLLNMIGKVAQAAIPTSAIHDGFQALDQVGASADKAKNILGWHAIKSLENMVADEWRFYQQTLKR